MHVFGSIQREGDAQTLAEHVRPHAGTIDQIFTGDIALVGLDPFDGVHARNDTLLEFNVGYLDIFDDSGTICPGPPGQCLGRVFRIGVSVVGLEPGCFEIVGMHQGKQLFGFIQANFLHFDTKCPRHLHGAVIFFLAGFGLSHPDRAGAQIACRLPCLFFQTGIKVGTVNSQLG